jgi:hypothetical protein
MYQMLLPAAILFSPEQQAGAAKPAPKPAAQAQGQEKPKAPPAPKAAGAPRAEPQKKAPPAADVKKPEGSKKTETPNAATPPAPMAPAADATTTTPAPSGGPVRRFLKRLMSR